MTISKIFGREILVTASKLLTHQKNSHVNLKFNTTLTNKCYSTSSDVPSYKFSRLEHEPSKLDTTGDRMYSSAGLLREAMPKHIAICLDGNRTWCRARGRDPDYTIFFDKNMLLIDLCLKWGVPKVSSLIWGIGNFTKRGQQANDFFFGQFTKFIEDNLEYFKRNGIKVIPMGETSMLSKSIQETIKQVEETTKMNTKLELSLAICYTGQKDITNATRKICEKVKQGIIQPSEVTEDTIEKELSYSSSLLPDLFIRTGGELRVGALLTWQVSHTELYFTDTLAPEFCEGIFVDALRSYQQRNRKFGK
ncbi:uncharacterized protein LOC141597325 [Silene latifolia]|uniref:uncharacterized protein LOC141597325 n=1 Tax=Silene latifolia TaxID=37657 RepID=UPI003D77B2FA